MIPQILVSNNSVDIDEYIQQIIKTHDISEHYVFRYEPEGKEFSIKQVRELKKELKFGLTEPRLFILLQFDTASLEAQNALLKTLEEHQENVLFILAVKRAQSLLPTILSRSKIISLDGENVHPEGVKKTTSFASDLEKMVAGDTKYLAVLSQNPLIKKNPGELFSDILSFFKNRFGRDPHAPLIMKEIIKKQSLVEHNHVDPQSAVDFILLLIHKTYSLDSASKNM